MPGDYQALEALHALANSDGYEAAHCSLSAYRAALLGVIRHCKAAAAREVGALLASDAYAITFQTIGSYRKAILLAITPHLSPSSP